VLKPAETTPLTALMFAEICQQADLPPGVVNIVTGDANTGQSLVAHPGIDKIAFTGSTSAGKEIARTCAVSGKRLTLELGGKAANIVFDDAAVDQAVEGIVNGIFVNQGHVCRAGSWLLVQESAAGAFLEALRRRMGRLRLGDPLDPNTDIGAINSRARLDKITGLVSSVTGDGASRWSAPCPLPDRGFWFRPTLLTEIPSQSRILREEISGPVLSVATFRTPEEAVAKANSMPHGMAAGVWTEKARLTQRLASALRAGVIWANTFNQFDPSSPFGGYGESGFGREGGRHGLEAYLDVVGAGDAGGGIGV
jgi:aldehyde dehydrogenase (NAD+)